MSYIYYAWAATLIYGFETIIIKLTSKYSIKNPWLFNILWNILFVVFMAPIFMTQRITIPTVWPNLIITSALSAVCCVLFMIATYNLDVSVLSPLYNVRTGLTVLFASFMLGETMNVYQGMLVVVIIVMSVLVTIDEKLSFKSFIRRDVLIALIFMVLLSFYSVYLKKTISDIGYWNATVWVAILNLVFSIPTYPKFKNDLHTLSRKQAVPIILVTLTSTIAFVVSNKAYEANVGITSVIMTFPFSMILAFILAMFWPKLLERHSMKVYVVRFIATAVMFVCASQLSLNAGLPGTSTNKKEVAEVELKKEMQIIQIVDGEKDVVMVPISSTVLEVLQKTREIEVKKYSFGTMVETISGVKNGVANKYWTFTINGKESPVGASEAKVKSGDVIEWSYKSL